MNDTLFNPPRRVLLRGFDADGRTGAVAWLKSQGIEVINMASLADLVLAGPESEPELLSKANVHGAKVVAWDSFCASMKAHKSLHALDHGGGAELLSEGLCGAGTSPGIPVVEGVALAPFEVCDANVRVLDLVLPRVCRVEPRDASRIPSREQFAHLCFDKPLLEAVRAVALGVLHGIPVALEGETAASKTSAVLFLAHLLGQPLVRLNLSGHTDAAELVGRYVPADPSAVVDWNELTATTPWLSAGSRRILAHASSEGRSLTDTERMAILGREEFSVNNWRFQAGYLPRAMEHGWWLLLDEMNLAETQVLERLNCALENPPSLVLTEGDGAVIGPRGDKPVHSAFRMMATLNPSEYAGRAVLSPAFADRWGVWHQAATPGEREIEQMLRTLVFGEHPRVVVFGRAYRAPASVPPFAELQIIPGIESLLQRLTVFHHGIFRAAGGGGATPSIGRLNRQRYSFSRRILLGVIRYVAGRIREGCAAEEALIPEAIQMFYLSRLKDDADRKAVNNILRAGGLL